MVSAFDQGTIDPQGVLCRAPGCGGLRWAWDASLSAWRCKDCGGPLPAHLTGQGGL
jgi:hypothetical protein